jgi:hypothetical protein
MGTAHIAHSHVVRTCTHAVTLCTTTTAAAATTGTLTVAGGQGKQSASAPADFTSNGNGGFGSSCPNSGSVVDATVEASSVANSDMLLQEALLLTAEGEAASQSTDNSMSTTADSDGVAFNNGVTDSRSNTESSSAVDSKDKASLHNGKAVDMASSGESLFPNCLNTAT